ncbi:M28 family peptidase [Haloferacaceae archaeon DSL9]
MSQLPLSVVGDAQTSTFGWDVLTDLVDVGNRMAGQDGERRGAELVAGAFREAGLRGVEIDEFEIPGWWRGSSSLTVREPHPREHAGTHDVLALPGSPSGTATGRLVDVGDGSYEEFDAAGDLEGAVAMVTSDTPGHVDRWLHRMEKYVSAAERGAGAFVFRNHLDGSLPPTGEIGYNNRPGPIPAVGVSAEVGVRLARYAADGPTEVTVDVDCRNAPATSRNVEAVVGPDAGPDVLVTAHVDAHDVSDGAMDNGAGSALVAEIGRLLATMEDDLDHRVRLVTFGSEEIGLRGASRWTATHDADGVKCVLNIDGAGASRNLRVCTNGFSAMRRVFEETTVAFDAPLSTSGGISPHGDQWVFVQEGIPSVMAGSTSDKSGRGWGHTHADTIDKLDSRDLRALAILLTDAAVRLADGARSIPHKSRETIRECIDEGYVTELKRGGRWPY